MDGIKLIKRDRGKLAVKSTVAVNATEVESEVREKLVKVVNKWISERSENRRTEKTFSDGKISEWRSGSGIFKKR